MSLNRKERRLVETLNNILMGRCHHGKLSNLRCDSCPLYSWCRNRIDSGGGYAAYIKERNKRINDIIFDITMNEALRR